MSFKLSSEQREFQDSFRSFLSEHLSASRYRSFAPPDLSGPAASRNDSLWKKYIELGLMDFFISPDSGSSSPGLDLFYVAYECGYALEPEGLWESLLAGPFLFRHLLQEELLPLSELAACRFTPALWPAHNTLELDAQRQVSGELEFVLCNGATSYLVCLCARASRACLIQAREGMTQGQWKELESVDATRKLSRWSLQDCPATELPLAAVTTASLMFRALKASEIAGACARSLDMTAEYVKTRKQFGVPIGSFQAVQHRLADMMLHVESMRSLCQFASWAVQGSPNQAELAARAALAHACEVGPTVVEGAIQLHGGIGFTWEYDLHWYLKRVKAIELLFSSESDTSALIDVAAAQQSLGGSGELS